MTIQLAEPLYTIKLEWQESEVDALIDIGVYLIVGKSAQVNDVIRLDIWYWRDTKETWDLFRHHWKVIQAIAIDTEKSAILLQF